MVRIFPIKKRKNSRRSGKKRKGAEGGRFARALETGVFGRWFLGMVVFGLSVLIISWQGVPLNFPVKGQTSSRDIVATCEFSFPDRIKTEQAIKAAVESQPYAYAVDENVLKEKEDILKEIVQALGAKESSPQDTDLSVSLPEGDAAAELVSVLAQVPDPIALENEVLSILERIYRNGILPLDTKRTLANTGQQEIMLVNRPTKEERRVTISSIRTPEEARAEAASAAERVYPEGTQLKEALAGILANLIEPNLEFDREKTEALRTTARKSIAPIVTIVSKGEKIVRQGEMVRPLHIQKLRAYQEQRYRQQPPISRFYYTLGISLLVFLLFFITVYSLERYHREISRSNSKLLMISVIVLLVLVLARVLQQISWHLPPRMMEFIRYICPVTVGSLLLCLLLGVRIAIFLTLILTFQTSLILGRDVGYLLVGVIAGVAGIFSISGARKRIELLRAGIVAGGVGFLTVAALGIINGLQPLVFLNQGIGSAAGGIVCAFVTLIALGLFESGFRVFSDIGLLELSDLNHPLLRKLMIRAPGTYHHSLMVATLAEGAAEDVGANPLLARVGAYFHDIGKILKPEYFSENETSGSSRHDTLIPSMSSLILIAHVKEGVDLARKHKLDKRIVDIIQQHHGTSLISYFYDRAERFQQMKLGVLEKDYRYPGPKPKSREAAIVMLADAMEAASISLERPVPVRLEALIKNIVQERFSDSQLDECDLTLIDLKKIVEKFVRLLSARYHTRVKYPEGKVSGSWIDLNKGDKP